jgi:thymidylate kinase
MLVAIEGIDGSGKTALAQAVVNQLAPLATFQKFPDYTTEIGKRILHMLNADPEHIDPWVLQALQVVNRVELLTKLRSQKLTICDRYNASGLVYGAEDGLDVPVLETLQTVLPRPAFNILLWVPPAKCYERVSWRVQDNQYGQRSLARMVSLAERYSRLWAQKQAELPSDGTAWMTITPGERTVEESAAEVVRLLRAHPRFPRVVRT